MTAVTGQAARDQASALVGSLAAEWPPALDLAGVDLGPALEQQLFFALRDGRRPRRGALRRIASGLVAPGVPLAAAAAGAVMSQRVPTPGPRPLVVLVRDPTHYPVLALIEAELQALAGESLAMIRVGRAASVAPPHAVAPRLADLFLPRMAADLLRHRRTVARALGSVPRPWVDAVGADRAEELRAIAADELGRIALGAAGLVAVGKRWRPGLLAAFDEIGTWARLLPAVARRLGIPSLDLPHAEAADAVAISGASYDRWAVYGPRAASVLRSAGIAAERIEEIGAPRFDPLVGAGVGPRETGPRRVLFAAQYVTGSMTQRLLEKCYAAAMEVARKLAPIELVVVTHPAEAPGTAARLVAGLTAPAGVDVRLERDRGLHAELAGADVLVTGWSNSVFEAAVAGVPAIAVSPGGVAPVDFAADGLALGATSPQEAAAAAASLQDDERRTMLVGKARAVAEERLGRLDGRASQRAARLMLSLAGRSTGAAAGAR